MILRRPDSSSLSTSAKAATALLFVSRSSGGRQQPERPRRPSNCPTAQETGRLHKAVVSVLARALECCLTPALDFRDPLPAVKRIDNRESNAGEKNRALEEARCRQKARPGAPATR